MGSVSGWWHISTTATFRRDWCTLRPCVESKNRLADNYMAVSIIGEFCVVVGSAQTIGMLEGEEEPEWPSALGLPHLWINVQGESSGALME